MSNYYETMDVLLSDVLSRINFDNEHIGRENDSLPDRISEIRERTEGLKNQKSIAVEVSFCCEMDNCVACVGATSGGVYYDDDCVCEDCTEVGDICIASHTEDCENCVVPHPSSKILCPCECH